MELKKYEDFKKEAMQLKNILLEYKKTGKQFVDPNFHPTLKIRERDPDVINSLGGWKRIDEICDVPLFQQDLIHPDFVQQGHMGDCYFISALARVAKQPYLVPSLFEIDTYNSILGRQKDSINIKCGAVVVFFHCFGRRTPVLIDTFMPTLFDQLVFSHPLDNTKSPWFCLVEKAFAKLNSSYSDIVGGSQPTSIYSMFGYYPIEKQIKDLLKPEKISKMSIFQRMMKYQKQGGVLATSIHLKYNTNGVTEEELGKKGLVEEHCYLILKAREHDGHHLICLRNPWGRFEWNGDWSDDSPLWTPELKKALDWKKLDDGTFWISEKDYLRYFTGISISKPIHPEWFSRRFYIQLTPGDHDGYQPESEKCKSLQRPNFAFQVTDPIKKGEKVRFYVLVERRHKLFYEDTGYLYESPLIRIYFAHNKGQKIDPKTIIYCQRSQYGFKPEICTGKCEVEGNDDIITIFIYRAQAWSYTEDCYALVYCDHDFKLYDIDKPDILIPTENNRGLVFDNFSQKHPDVAPPIKIKKMKGHNVLAFGDVTDSCFNPSRADHLASEKKKVDADLKGLYSTFTTKKDDDEEEEDDEEEDNKAGNDSTDADDDDGIKYDIDASKKSLEIKRLKEENSKLKKLLQKATNSTEKAINDLKNEMKEALEEKEKEKEEALKLKDKEKEEAIKLKDKEMKDALKNKNKEMQNALKAKDKEMQDALKNKNKEMQNALKLKDKEMQDALKEKDKEIQDALNSKNKSDQSISKDDALIEKDKEITRNRKEIEKLKESLKKLQKEKDDLAKKLEDKKSHSHHSSTRFSYRVQISGNNEYDEEEDISRIENDINEILREEEEDDSLPAFAKAHIFFRKKK